MRKVVPAVIVAIIIVLIAAFAVANWLPTFSLAGFNGTPPELRKAFATALADCGDTPCAALNIRVRPVAVDAEARASGTTERWCIAYTQVRLNTGQFSRRWLRWAYQTARPATLVIDNINGQYVRGDETLCS